MLDHPSQRIAVNRSLGDLDQAVGEFEDFVVVRLRHLNPREAAEGQGVERIAPKDFLVGFNRLEAAIGADQSIRSDVEFVQGERVEPESSVIGLGGAGVVELAHGFGGEPRRLAIPRPAFEGIEPSAEGSHQILAFLGGKRLGKGVGLGDVPGGEDQQAQDHYDQDDSRDARP